MKSVTAITPDPRRPGRVIIELGSAVAASVSIEVAHGLGLRVGEAVTPELEAALADEAAAQRTYDRALRLLAARARSVRELRRRLLAAREPPAQVEQTLQRLLEAGLLDDGDYARALARSQIVDRGYAPRRLKQELARRGVDRAVADRAVEIVMTEDAAPGSYGAERGIDLGETIERLARRKLRSLASVDTDARWRRLYAFLARRGYEHDDIRRVMSRLRSEEGATDSP